MKLQSYILVIFLILFFLPVPKPFAQNFTPFNKDYNKSDSKMIVRVYLTSFSQMDELKKEGVEIVSEEGTKWVDVSLNNQQLEALRKKGFRADILVTQEELRGLKFLIDPQYHTYEELTLELDSLAQLYPAIAKKESLGVSTQEQRTIWGFKISKDVNQDKDKPRVLFDGVHHACEVMGLELCLHLIKDLLDGYGSNPQITSWVDGTEIWFIPLLNPDGHSAVTNGISLYWRKNGRDIDGDNILYEYQCNDWWTCYTEGVNLNRNYDFNWSSGGSPNPWHYDYRGSAPFSESETQAIRDLALKYKFSLSITFHSYGEVVIYPWYWSGTPAPDDLSLTDIAYNLSSRMTKEIGDPYNFQLGSALSGMNTNWFYGALGDFAYTVEVLPYPQFIPPGNQIDSVYQKVKPGMLYLLERVNAPSLTGIITDSVTSELLKAEVRILELYSTQVLPRTSDSLFGRYRWLLLPGNYTLQILKDGYYTETISGLNVGSGSPTVKDASLVKFKTGDANLDRTLSVSDVVFIINYLFKGGPAPSPLYIADANCDTKVSVSDAVHLINYLFKGGPPPSC
ncbi:MAG: M14 family zinc carboxypeptidase [candidate division Zixibacteria bacterium]|nr:M14 family zinc carboxypeptidase [candidate division Zixibacteria bacterium]